MQRDNPCTWTTEHKNAFLNAKNCLQSSSLLTHFDPPKELIVVADTFPIGIGTVLSHHMKDGSERPIAYTFRSLAPLEQKYSQIEKEPLALFLQHRSFISSYMADPFASI